MNASPDEIRRIYSELTDEALLEMNREDLTEIARICYDQELAQRRLEPRPPEPAGDSPEESVPDPGNLVQAATFLSAADARLAQALLKSENIPAFLADEISDIYVKGLSGPRLFVPAHYLDAARALLEAEVSDDELAAQAEATPPPDKDLT